MLGTLTTRRRWVWITGNHDAALVDHCGGEIMDEAEVAGLVLRHEAVPGETRPELSDRKSVVKGKSVSVRVDLGGRRILKKKNNQTVKSQKTKDTTITGQKQIITRMISQQNT